MMTPKLPRSRLSRVWLPLALAAIAAGFIQTRPALAGAPGQQSKPDPAVEKERKRQEAEIRKQAEDEIQRGLKRMREQQQAADKQLKALQNQKPTPAAKPAATPAAKPTADPAAKPAAPAARAASSAQSEPSFWSRLFGRDRDQQPKVETDPRRREAQVRADIAKWEKKAKEDLRRAQANLAKGPAKDPSSIPVLAPGGSTPPARKSFWTWLFGDKPQQAK